MGSGERSVFAIDVGSFQMFCSRLYLDTAGCKK